MFEHRQQPLLSPGKFLIRQLIFLIAAIGIIGGSLLIGVLGYHIFESLT
jgi:hypothetical protein